MGSCLPFQLHPRALSSSLLFLLTASLSTQLFLSSMSQPILFIWIAGILKHHYPLITFCDTPVHLPSFINDSPESASTWLTCTSAISFTKQYYLFRGLFSSWAWKFLKGRTVLWPQHSTQILEVSAPHVHWIEWKWLQIRDENYSSFFFLLLSTNIESSYIILFIIIL